MMGLLRRFEEDERIEKLKANFKTAKDLGLNRCIMCGFCCNRRTCVPTPDELVKIAEFLKLNSKECIQKYFAIDRASFGDDYFVKPIGENIKDLAGKFIPDERTYNEGKCIFLDENNKCRIQIVKPRIAKETGCWKKEVSKFDPVSKWNGNILEKRFGIKTEE